MSDRFIAVDWGTTNRRAYVLEAGIVLRTERDEAGAAHVTDFPEEARRLRERLDDLPMLMAGMVGSTIGWAAAPYVEAPVGLEALAASLLHLDDRTAIVPGIAFKPDQGGGDVMRGEEVQLLGAVAAGLVEPNAMLCQPGTHCKWAVMHNGRIDRFVTAMTGELFALLRTHSLLSAQLSEGSHHPEAFEEGVAEGRRRDLAASLFSVRADALLSRRAAVQAASFASGVLIGADVAARLGDIGELPLYILADPQLGGLYATAARLLGRESRIIDSHAAFVAGITQIWNMRQ